jgi:hypothetical protein
MPKRTPITLETVRRLFAELPGVEEGPCYGTPGFRVKGKMVARIWEDGETLVVKCGDDERDFRIQANPTVYYVTDHYRGYPIVLVHLSKARLDDLRELLTDSWRRLAPKRLLASYQDRPAGRSRR